jgi:hypothetical protein
MEIFGCCEHCPEDCEYFADHAIPCAHGCDDVSSEDGLSDVEADAMTLVSAGWGTDEDYGYYGGGDDY